MPRDRWGNYLQDLLLRPTSARRAAVPNPGRAGADVAGRSGRPGRPHRPRSAAVPGTDERAKPEPMCGISGIVTREPFAPELVAPVRRMNAALAHRGPDGEGEHLGAHAMLAMRRLSIIDPAGGSQPLYNEDRSVALIANGEIYNSPELRRDARASGSHLPHRQRLRGHRCISTRSTASTACSTCAACSPSRSGTHRAGDSCSRATAWARSRSTSTSNRAGCSSPRSSSRCCTPASCRSSSTRRPIDQYFHYQFVPEPRDADPQRAQARSGAPPGGRHRPVEGRGPLLLADGRGAGRSRRSRPLVLRERLEDIGSLITRADRKVGVALSGGLDSSLVAALAARKRRGASLQAFSVGYEDRPPSDERTRRTGAGASICDLPFHQIEVEHAQRRRLLSRAELLARRSHRRHRRPRLLRRHASGARARRAGDAAGSGRR